MEASAEHLPTLSHKVTFRFLPQRPGCHRVEFYWEVLALFWVDPPEYDRRHNSSEAAPCFYSVRA